MGEGGRVATVTFAHLTDIGRVRARNEDFLGAFEPDDPALLSSRGRLFVVADGMGGHTRGDVASRIAVETLHDTYYEAEHHPSAHVILRALGLAEEVTIEAQGPLALRSGDTLVLCTDGLTRQVRPHEIRRLAQIRPPSRACERLVSLANERGGQDNITLQLIRFGSRRFLPAALLSLRGW